MALQKIEVTGQNVNFEELRGTFTEVFEYINGLIDSGIKIDIQGSCITASDVIVIIAKNS